MADYDNQANILPVFGTAAAVAVDGTVKTATIDTKGFGSVTFVAVTVNAIAYTAVTWAMDESVDGSVWTAVAADDILKRGPKNLATTSKVFHAGYRGKKQYVRAAATATGGGTQQLTALLGHPKSGPIWQDADYDQWSA